MAAGSDTRALLTSADREAFDRGDIARISNTGLKILSGETSFMGGAVTGAKETVLDAPVQLLEKGLRYISPTAADWVKEHDSSQRSNASIANFFGGAPSTAGQIVGNIGGTLAGGAALAPVRALSALPRVAAVVNKVPAVARAAAMGAVVAPLTQRVDDNAEDFWGEKAAQAGFGAVGGGLLSGAARGVAKLAGGVKLTPEQELLRNSGVTLTPGRILGGMYQKAEDAGTSVFGMGGKISEAQARDVAAVNRAMYQRTLDPITAVGPPTQAGFVNAVPTAASLEVGHKGVDALKTALRSGYTDVLSRVSFAPDRPFMNAMGNITSMVSAMDLPQQRQFLNTMRATLGTRFTSSGRATGESLQNALSELQQKARAYMGSPAPADRELGAAFRQVHEELMNVIMRTNPGEAQNLRNLQRAYATYAQVRKAASAVGADEGVFTPAQLNNAVRASDARVGKEGYATGKALNQDLSDAAKHVLSRTVPDSGTPMRGLLAAIATMNFGPKAWALPLIGRATYANPQRVERMANMLVNPSQRRKNLAAALRRAPAGVVGGEAFSGGLEE